MSLGTVRLVGGFAAILGVVLAIGVSVAHVTG